MYGMLTAVEDVMNGKAFTGQSIFLGKHQLLHYIVEIFIFLATKAELDNCQLQFRTREMLYSFSLIDDYCDH